MTAPRCRDCVREGISTIRKTPHPGPRCATHHRAVRAGRRDIAWERRLMGTYGITPGEYWAIHEYQGGVCWICARATGARKRLSVDHDHKTGYIRGLLCGPCNRDVVGHLRDDPEAFYRGAAYLREPPAIRVIGYRVAPIEAPNLTTNGA